jgi:septal ring factor EnvC (AmiA/AmiB activator)
MEKEQGYTRKKTIMEQYPSRQALVYSGAAFLILVTGLRTVIQVSEEGFGIIEFVTIGALAVEFSLLLLYAFTIYQAGIETFKLTLAEEAAELEAGGDPDAPPKASVEISSQDMPEVAKEINRFTTHASSLLEAVSKSVAENEKLNAHLRELAEDQLAIKVRQEIQRLLNANMESSK